MINTFSANSKTTSNHQSIIFSNKLFLLLPIFLNIYPLITAAQNKQSVLWEISGHGLKKKSYIFGTVHFAPYTIIKNFPQIEKIINNSDIGLFEITHADTSTYAPKSEVSTLTPLDKIFSEKDYGIVDSFFIKNGYGSIRPHNNDASLRDMLVVAIMIKNLPADSTMMFFDEWIEQHFFINQKKACIQLDDYKVLARLYHPSGDDLIGMAHNLVDIIKSPHPFDDKDNIINLTEYTSTMTFNLNLGKKFTKNSPNSSIVEPAFQRNLLWMPKIEQQLKYGSCFIGVGAGHLGYTKGLIQLLKNKGYTLIEVKLKHINN